MRISDWSSDVCSSDLPCGRAPRDADDRRLFPKIVRPRQARRRLDDGCLYEDPALDARFARRQGARSGAGLLRPCARALSRSRSEEHTSELQSLMRISYAVFCLKKKKNTA